jgi:nucleoside-diphosphate-sugar epimerase
VNCAVTGCAGFVGSHVAEGLLRQGDFVRGIDCMSPSYDREIKLRNLQLLRRFAGFSFHEVDIAQTPVGALVADCDVVYHLAGEAGTRTSWGDMFRAHLSNNIHATQTILEAIAGRGIRVVIASSSSVYGAAASFPVSEGARVSPLSPYAASKASAELLCQTYARAYAIPAVILRYFTVYGPRQRPDMAFSRFVRAALDGQPVTLYGDGRHMRDFTYVDDVVRATLAAGACEQAVGETLNVGAGRPVAVRVALDVIQEALGSDVAIREAPRNVADPVTTVADIRRARDLLGFEPSVTLEEGLRRQVDWMRATDGLGGAAFDGHRTG